MDRAVAPRAEDIAEAEVAERLTWLLRLRWLVVPIFVAVDLATDLLQNRRAPWTAFLIGAVLLAANGLYGLLISARAHRSTLIRFARLESAAVVAIPIAVVLLHGDPSNALRYGVLVGVVGAAVVLPRTAEVGVVAMWAVASLIVSDAIAAGFDPARIPPGSVARWATEAGIVLTVAMIAGHLHASRSGALQRLARAEAGVVQARADWESTFDGLHEMVVVTDRDGRVLRANRAFARMLGSRPGELAGRPLPEVLAGHPDRWWSVEGDGIVEVEDPLLDSAIEVTSTVVGDRVVRIARDVGEERRLYSRLVQADKLAAVGVLASGVAHEINNPTAFVTSNLTELRRYVAAYEAALGELSALGLEAGRANEVRTVLARADVAFARREAPGAIGDSLAGMDRIRQLVGNLRSVSRRDQPGEPAAAVELGDVVESVVRTAAAELRSAAAQVEVRERAWVLGRRGELVDVVLNLVVNAVQARDEGRPNRISIALTRDAGAAVLRVSDTGKGIAPAHMKRLFEPFFTTKAPGEGTGLGLSLARKIVLAHGGSIDVTSEAGAGTTFTVRLPAIDPDVAAPGRLATRTG